MATMKFVRIAPIAAVVLLAACAAQPHEPVRPQPAGPESVRAEVSAITARLPRLHEVAGRWQSEDTASIYHAYFDHGRVRYIMETAGGERTQGYAVNKYYYNARGLFYFHGQGSAGSEDVVNPHPAQIDAQIAFDGTGRVTRAVKTLNGRKVALEPGEAAAIRTHAGELRRQAQAELGR
ncbi:MAG TPA: hypothetical protein VFM97_02510 [Gammaproteobacteria bacterium]|nr:hypothetical protein [Gammaproteobacteria bacterium]